MGKTRNILTFIPSQGRATFKVRDGHPRLESFHTAEWMPDYASVHAYHHIVKGLAGTRFLHLDIQTPFGESVTDEAVEKALSESLGKKRGLYRLQGWHLFFAEDTNQGSNHRVFAELAVFAANEVNGGEGGGATDKEKIPRLVDAWLPVEAAIESLAENFAIETGQADFQLLLPFASYLYSLLFIAGQPFHLLRLNQENFVEGNTGTWNWNEVETRLIRHREFGLAARPTVTELGMVLPTLSKNDGRAPIPALKNWKIRAWDCGCAKPFKGDWDPKYSSAILVHFGLALAATTGHWESHDGLSGVGHQRNITLRQSFLAAKTTALALILCLTAWGAYLFRHHRVETRIAALAAEARVHGGQVESIERLRIEKNGLEEELLRMQPVWTKPLAWDAILAVITQALPTEAGMEGLAAMNSEGTTRLSFKVWVKDWDEVGAMQEKLSASPYFSHVELSEQKRDSQSGIVAFYVNCRLRRI